MGGHFAIACVACGAPAGPAFATACGGCGGLLDVSYDLACAKLRDSDNPYLRYQDLLPVSDPSLFPDAAMTPTVHARNLGRRLGLDHLYLKDETTNPSRSTKDRMAAVALPFLHESDVTHFCASSTGNSSTAYAQAIGQIPGMRMELFTADDFRHRVNYAATSQVSHHVMRDASFVDAGDYAGTYARANGLVAEGGFFNLGRREGLKLPWFEIAEQIDEPMDWYVQAVSSAMGVYGVYKAAEEAVAIGLATRKPRVLCVQQTSCSPMVQAWEEGCEGIRPHHIVARPSGIAEAILRGNPTRAYPFIRTIVLDSGGAMAAVDETEILQMQAWVLEDEGIAICPSAATAVAGLAKLALQGGRDLSQDRIVVNLTGGGRDDAEPAPVDHWLRRSGDSWIEAAEADTGRG